MSLSLLFSLLVLVLVLVGQIPTLVLSDHHVIDFRTRSSRLSCLVWDPIFTHHVVGSAVSPEIYSVSDAGVVENIITESSVAGSASTVAAVAVDSIRRRLVVAFSNPASVAAYDLKSIYRRLFFVPLPQMEIEPSGLAVDLETGDIFVSAAQRAVIWKVGSKGDDVKVLTEFKRYGDEGLGGLVHVNRGYLLVLQTSTAKVFKVDSDDGAIKEVLSTKSTQQLAPSGNAIALRRDLTSIVSTNKSLLLLKSDDSWAQAAIHDKYELKSGEKSVGVTVRDGKFAFVLVESEEGDYRIEEVVWPIEKDGDMLWGLILLGFGFTYFLFWRFQMRRLVGGLNKKHD